MGVRYQILEKIGQGGVGEVYLARDTQLDREVAIKRLKPGEGEDDDELFREARALSALQHPNVVTVFDIGSDEEGPFAVMELLKGETLDKTVERSPLTLEDFRSVVRQSLEGVIAAHSVGLLHRDIKPTNLMVSWLPSGKFQLKILDFGLAKFSTTASEQTSDQEDGILGSIFFMAPEQFERANLDARTDVYALGCVYYYALTGLHPFDGETAPQVMASHLRHDVRDLSLLRPDLPAEVCRWVMWLINRKVEERPESAKEAYDYFREGNAGEPVGLASAATGVVPTATGRRPVLVTKTGPVAVRQGAPTQLRPATAPVVARPGPVVLSGATGGIRPGPVPAFTPPAKSGFPKWALVTLPLLLAGGAFFILQFVDGKKEIREQRERFRELAEAKSPEGDTETVRWLVGYLSQTENDNSIAAAKILSKLEGDEVGEAMIAQLDNFEGTALNNLIDAIGLSGYPGAGPALMEIVRESKSDTTRARALAALALCASERDLVDLIQLLPELENPLEQAALQAAILRICRARPSAKLRTAPLIVELRRASANPELRRHVIGMLGELGEPTGLPALIRELGASDPTVRRAAIRALSEWKTSAPAVDLMTVAEESTLKPEREAALIGFIRLVGSAADLPMKVRAEQLERAYAVAKENGLEGAAPQVFIELQKLPVPGALAFAKGATSDPAVEKEASRAVTVLERSLARVVTVTGGSATLPASAAQIVGSNAAYLSREGGGVIGEWDDSDTYVTWTVDFPEPGNYAIGVEQSAPSGTGGTFQVAIGGAIYDAKTRQTDSEESFAKVEACTATIGEADTYRIDVRPLEVEGDVVMFLKSVTITKM